MCYISEIEMYRFYPNLGFRASEVPLSIIIGLNKYLVLYDFPRFFLNISDIFDDYSKCFFAAEQKFENKFGTNFVKSL